MGMARIKTKLSDLGGSFGAGKQWDETVAKINWVSGSM